jgi:hypothetical protein
MRTKAIFIIPTICALAVATVVPVAAVPFSTPITIEITPGTLSITAPTGPVDLGEWVNTVGGGTISEQLGQVQVLQVRVGRLVLLHRPSPQRLHQEGRRLQRITSVTVQARS